MANPKQPQPERKPSAAASQPPSSAASRETKRPSDSVPIAKATFTKLPMNFGRYQVEKLLGKGAMGAVYLARDTQLGRLVALKIPKLSGSGAAKLLQRLKTEAKAAAQIDHPSVCPVYDSGDIDGTSYIAMQYIEGETLKEHLQNQPLTSTDAVKLILLLAEGLAEAHSQDIYHRDLKPENIKLNRRGIPVIMDFGLAKLAATLSADAGKTQSGTILGSPAYMSPEQASGQVAEIDHRSDLYSLGVMLFEMLTGQWPFTGAALQVMGQKTILDPPSPLTIKPDLNPELAAVCHKLIAKKREDRYQTAKELIDELQALGMGTATQSATGSVVTGQPQTSVPTLVPSFEQEDTFSSMIARKRQEANRGGATVKLGSNIRRITQSAVEWWRGKSSGVKWTGLATGVLIMGLIGLWASGAFIKVKTKQGTLVIQVNEPGADVFVDGEKVDVTWADGQMKATVQVKAGERQVEVKKDGFSVAGKQITFKDGDREIFKAKLIPDAVGQKKIPLEGQLAGEERSDNDLKMKFVWCRPGKFTMGSPPSEPGRIEDEGSVDVTLTKGFWLGKFEVTQADWERVMQSTPWKGKEFGKESGGYPATYLSWEDATDFCQALTSQERKSGRLPNGWEYTLPTEAQWEYACRAGSNTRFTFGNSDDELGSHGWFHENAKKIGETYAHEVGKKKANAWGLHDMHGNIWEWCEDEYADKLPGGTDPLVSAVGSVRVPRGGCWFNAASYCRSAFRQRNSPVTRYDALGLRVALSPMRPARKNTDEPKNDRAVAAWILSLGGTVGIRMNGHARDVAGGGSLPGQDFVLEKIFLAERPLTVGDLARLEKLANLKQLELRYCAVGNEGAAQIGKLSNLSHLVLWRAGLTDAGLVHLAGLGRLNLLCLFANTSVTDAGLPQFAVLKRLNHLDLNGTRISNDGLVHIRSLPNLVYLNIQATLVTDAGLAHVGGLVGLRGLALGYSKIGDAGLGHLKGLSNLESLDASASQVTDAGLARLAPLPNLHDLSLSRTAVGDEGLKYLAGMAGLARLSLDNSNVSDAGVESLLGLRKLVFLSVKETRISAAGYARLKSAFPNAEIAWSAVKEPPTKVATPVGKVSFAKREGGSAGEERDDNELKMKLVWCPPGKFTMGSPPSEKDRTDYEDQVEVTLTKGLWLGKYEVTQGEWERIMASTPWKGEKFVKESGNYPATWLSWDDATAFCRSLTVQERKAGRLPDDWEYKLPTEAQWEYACRAGSKARYSFGDNEVELGTYGWYDKNAMNIGETYAHEVGMLKANAWSLHDVHGNVWEWCEDVYADKRPGGTDPKVASEGSFRVYRGGGWYSGAALCRSASRYRYSPDYRSNLLGFRVALSSVK